MTTSACSRAGRPPVPAKMTSSMSPPRMDFALVAPIAQRTLSSKLDLPQPFGPTMPVSPASIGTRTGSTKDLNPERRSSRSRNRSRSLELGIDQLRELIIIGEFRFELLAVEDQRRRAGDAEFLCALFGVLDALDAVGIGD